MDVSKHAYARAKERLSWGHVTLKRMSDLAWMTGIIPEETNGRLKRYLTEKLSGYVGVSHVRIYGEYVYFYSDYTLITVYRLPNELIKVLPKRS